MRTYLLDANHASALLRPGHLLADRIIQAAQNGDRFILPAIVLEEIQFGVAATRDPMLRARRMEALDRLVDLLEIVDLSAVAAREGGRLRGELRRNGRQISPADASLAALAVAAGHTVLTADRDFAAIGGAVQVEDWLDG